MSVGKFGKCDDMVRLDLTYAINWPLWSDIKSSLRNPPFCV
jgi:lipopolysaccharide/colanic/teichoic acid biosynthesis glycosyltransferase